MAAYIASTANIAKRMGKPQGEVEATPQGPGTKTDTLMGAIKSLQNYTKMADQSDPDVTLVRKIISEISRLVAKDQEEDEGGMNQMPGESMMANSEMGGGMMGEMGGNMMTGAPQQPDLDSIVRGGGMMG